MADNKRNFFRVELAHPLCSDLKIIGAYGKELDSKKTRVCIYDISAGGMRFRTRLMMPAEASLLLEFRFTLLGQDMKMIGFITRKQELETGVFEYGVKFSLFDYEVDALTRTLNTLAARLKRTPVLSTCSFCTKEEMDMILNPSEDTSE